MCPHPEDDDRVCASDGDVYSSECFMKLSACRKGMDLQIQSQSVCDQTPPSVSSLAVDLQCKLFVDISLLA